jgi:hypothetical protein
MRLLLLTILFGCGPKASRTAAKAEGRYSVASPTGDWSRVNPGGADKAWFHTELGASIYFDSNCMARFDDGRLQDLITHLTFGLAQDEPVREESMTLDGREALLRVYDGALDGVPVRVGAVVIKKDRCLYDGLYIAAPVNFEDGWGAFVEVVSGFKTRGR